jgi:micrococcal nuclease
MKLLLKLAMSSLLLIGLAACGQLNVITVNDSTVSTAQTSEKSTGNTSNQIPVTLVRDVDGDTVVIRYKNRQDGDINKPITVCMLLIDTPEDVKPNTCVQPFGLSAAARTKELVSNGNMTLEFDGNKTDKYGRLLAYVFVNGKSVQETLLKQGFARVAYIYQSHYKYLDQFKKAEAVAKGKSLNIWSKKGFATERGFVGCASAADKTTAQKTTTNQNNESSGTTTSGGNEYFANCTLLRQKYHDGVKKGHPAYREQLDRNKDGVACESN